MIVHDAATAAIRCLYAVLALSAAAGALVAVLVVIATSVITGAWPRRARAHAEYDKAA